MPIEEMIPYSDFAALRFVEFTRAEPSLVVYEHGNWIFMGRTWIGEGLGAFSDFLRPEERPDEVGAITLDLQNLPLSVQESIFSRLHLPIRMHETKSALINQLGLPRQTNRYVEDRLSLDFLVGKRWRYLVTCTVHEEHGLLFVVVMRQDMLVD